MDRSLPLQFSDDCISVTLSIVFLYIYKINAFRFLFWRPAPYITVCMLRLDCVCLHKTLPFHISVLYRKYVSYETSIIPYLVLICFSYHLYVLGRHFVAVQSVYIISHHAPACRTPRWRAFYALPSGINQCIKMNHINWFNYFQSQRSCEDYFKRNWKIFFFLQRSLSVFIYPVYFWYYFYIYKRQKVNAHGIKHVSFLS